MASFDGAAVAYDCASCEEGDSFQTVESITIEQGGYDLFSYKNDGVPPKSVFADSDNDSGGADAFLKGASRT